MDTKIAKAIASQYYVAKGLKKNPAKIIKFIINNPEFFPDVNDAWLEAIKRENHVTEDDIKKQPDVFFEELKQQLESTDEIINETNNQFSKLKINLKEKID